jgi:hypothetical protein
VREPVLSFDLGMAAYIVLDADGFYNVQVSLFGSGSTGSQPMEAYHPTGFLSVPRDPDVDPEGKPRLGANVLYAWEGNQAHAILLNDPRVMGLLPAVKKGGAAWYAHLPNNKVAFSLFDGDDGTFQIYVPHGTTGTTIAIDVRDPDNVSIQLQHGLGHGITIEGNGKHAIQIRNRANNAAVIVDDDQVTVNGTLQVQGGVAMGGAGAKTLANSLLVDWINTVLRPALAAAPVGGGPIVVAEPPAGVITTTTKAA